MAWFHGASYTWKYIWVLYLNFSLVLHHVPPGKETTLDSERGLRCLSVRHGSQAKLIKAAQHQGLPSTIGLKLKVSCSWGINGLPTRARLSEDGCFFSRSEEKESIALGEEFWSGACRCGIPRCCDGIGLVARHKC